MVGSESAAGRAFSGDVKLVTRLAAASVICFMVSLSIGTLVGKFGGAENPISSSAAGTSGRPSSNFWVSSQLLPYCFKAVSLSVREQEEPARHLRYEDCTLGEQVHSGSSSALQSTLDVEDFKHSVEHLGAIVAQSAKPVVSAWSISSALVHEDFKQPSNHFE